MSFFIIVGSIRIQILASKKFLTIVFKPYLFLLGLPLFCSKCISEIHHFITVLILYSLCTHFVSDKFQFTSMNQQVICKLNRCINICIFAAPFPHLNIYIQEPTHSLICLLYSRFTTIWVTHHHL